MTTFSNIETCSSDNSEFNQDCSPCRDTPKLIEIIFLEDSEDSDDIDSECSQSPRTPEQPSKI